MILQILGLIAPLVSKYFDSDDKANAFLNDIKSQFLENEAELRRAQRDIIVAEAQGESWLQRNWRPILMLSIVSIVVNNYLLVPWIQAFGYEAPILELPSELFNLMTVGVGGYIIGRSGEKIADRLPWQK